MRIALVLSLVVNACLMVALVTSPDRSSAPAAETLASPADASEPACGRCDEELRRCRQAAFAGVSLLGSPSSTEREPAGKPSSSSSSSDAPLAAAHADVELQADVLCEIARTHLRDHWDRERENLLRAARYVVSDEGQLEKGARETLERFTTELALSDDDARRLAERYLPLREALFAKARAQVATEPPDLDGLYRTARELYAAEDALVEELYGAEAKERLRLGEAEPRTAILAIVGSLAGIPWTEVQW